MRRHIGFVGLLLLFLGSTAFAQEGGAVTFQAAKDELRLSNGLVELVLDAQNGYFRHIRNLVTGTEHKPATDGVWPFGVWLGTREQPQQKVAEISADSPQKMKYRFNGTPEDGTVELVYPALAENTTGESTGVRLEVHVRFHRGWDYFLVSAKVKNDGKNSVTNFYAGTGKLQAEPGAHLENGNGHDPGNSESPVLGYGPWMITCWFDYSGAKGGIGIGYINPQGTKTVFETNASPDNTRVSWRTFNVKGLWQDVVPPEQTVDFYPLQPGETFQTGQWLLAPHRGDWHRMADIYREHYAQAFRGNYLRWADMSPFVKQAHLQVCFWIAQEKQLSDGKWVRTVTNSFSDVVSQVAAVIQRTGIRPENVMVMLTRVYQRSLTNPDYFPIATDAGGEAALQETLHQLKDEMHIGSIMYYVHPWYNHPDALLYVKDADSGHNYGVYNNHYACQQNSAWAALWRDTLLPKFREIRADGLYLDEGAMCWSLCDRTGPAHLHGSSAVGVLQGNAKGSAMIQRLMREGLGPNSFLMTEGGNDIEGRWFDIFQHFAAPEPRYTNPEHIYAIYYDDPSKREALNEAAVNGFLPQINVFAKHPFGDEVWDNLRHMAEVRRELAQAGAPGYPQGFRDNVGLSVSDSALIAKVFRAPEGITVTYCAPRALEADITVDGAALDHPSLGTVKRHVTVDPLKAGFFVLRP